MASHLQKLTRLRWVKQGALLRNAGLLRNLARNPDLSRRSRDTAIVLALYLESDADDVGKWYKEQVELFNSLKKGKCNDN